MLMCGKNQHNMVLKHAVQISFPRTKRHHHKSRLGCGQCRLRRVKCDETKPVCNTCRQKQLHCTYDNPSISPTKETGQTSISDKTLSADARESLGSILQSSNRHDDEGELIRTYLEHVAPSFSRSNSRPEQSWIWEVFVPSQAFQSRTVLNAILAAGAIYLHFEAKRRGDDMQAAAYLSSATRFGSAFIHESQSQLHILDPANTNNDLCSTRLLFVLALAFFRQCRSAETDRESAWNWLHLARGVPAVHETLVRQQRNLHHYFPFDMAAENLQAEYRWTFDDASRGLLQYLDRTRQARFKSLRFAHAEGWFHIPDVHSSALLDAIDHLSEITEMVCTGNCSGPFRVIISWITRLPGPLVNMLVEEHPAMLALYTHWLMLVMLLEDHWWVGDMGRAGIVQALHQLETGCGDFAPILSWPRDALEIDRVDR